MKAIIIYIFASLSITTSYCQNVAGVFLDKRDHREYKTVTIGKQVWFAENFAYLPQVDTVDISVFGYKGHSIKEAKSTMSFKKYGALYSWNSAKKFAPDGWRLPTDADWQQLEKEIGIDKSKVNQIGWRGEKNEVEQLKATEPSRFNVVFGGWRTDYGEFKFQGMHANFWCADSYDRRRAYERLIGINNAKIGREYGNKGCGFSVRYIRDMPIEAAISYPDKNWKYLDKSEQFGWNSEKLNKLNDFVRDSTNTTGLVIIQSGKILFDYGNTEELSYISSCRKSILSMLYGKYVENGTIDLNKKLSDLKIDDIGGILPSEKQATINDLIKSKPGVYHLASDEGGNEFLFPARGSKKPGTHYVYNNWDFNAAGFIFEQETGQSIYNAFDKDIAQHIGLEDWDITKQVKSGDTTKSKFLAYHFVFSTRDMARIGYLLLRNGQWKDQKVIPKKWISQMTTITTSLEEMKTVDPRLKEWPFYKWGYGLMWRVWDSPDQLPEFNKAYTATGNAGQYITVIPSLDMVITLKTKIDYGRRTEYDVYDKLLNKVIDAKK
ncbi:MAG: hypothetical protein EOO42_00055 [Flavobacteriales bacterium]|nr:MAG: hypothetical protein EOO42_00055 [Flavobacteriales bacterium]